MEQTKNKSKLFNYFFCHLIGIAIVSFSLFAADDSKVPTAGKPAAGGTCSHELNLLGGLTRIIPSGRETTETLQFLERRTLASEEAGKSIGYKMSPHIMEMVPAGELMALATLGRHAIPTWIDGAGLLNPWGAAGVMEFVTPGCPTCRSFYSASTSPVQQGSIIDHVHGHNDYSAHSIFSQIRNVDVIQESLEFSQYITNLYHNYDQDIVSQFLQELYSFKYLQDLSRHTFEDPSTFDPKNRVGVQNLPDRINHANHGVATPNPYTEPLHPRSPTPSVLQFMVNNLPPEAPEWQRETLRRFERIMRIYGFYTSDKYTNEGWATLSMEMLPGHTEEFSTDSHMFEYMNLLQGVSGWASFSNPYWLGREYIRIARAKFEDYFEKKRRPSFDAECAAQNITGREKDKKWVKERDKAFVKYFHENFMESKTDYDIIQEIIDQSWVDKHGLFLYRPARWDEYDPTLPPPQHPIDGALEQKVIVSTDAKRVVREIAKRYLDRRFQIPRVQVNDANAFGRNVLQLTHDMVREDDWKAYGKPLKLWGTAQTLYLAAKRMGKPVSLETVHVKTGNTFVDVGFFWPIHVDIVTSKRIRLEVDPRGKVQVFELPDSLVDDMSSDQLEWFKQWFGIEIKLNARGENIDLENIEPWDITKEVPDLEIQEKLQQAIDDYKFDQEISVNSKLHDAEKQKLLSNTVSTIVDGMVGGQFSVLSHAPTAPDAIARYKDMLNRRVYESLMRALQGKLKSKQTGSGLRFRVMPLVPEIDFDEEMTEAIKDKAPPPADDPAFLVDTFNSLKNAKSKEDLLAAERKLETVLLKQEKQRDAFRSFKEKEKDLVESGQIIKSISETVSGHEALGSDGRPKKKGDKVWGPAKPPPGGGGGKPRDGNDDGDDGDDPGGDDAGDGSVNPYEIEIPIEVISEFLGAQIELPFLKPKAGDLDSKTTIRDGGVQKPTGDLIWSRMMGTAMGLGSVMAKKMKLDPRKTSRFQLARLGMKMIQPPDYVVPDRIVDPLPDTNAVVFFVVDQSGSMWGWPIEKAKQFIFNVKAALKSKYKQLKFGFVSFDTKGHVYYDENEFWKSFQGGGTDYSEGFRVAHDELNKFNPQNWDRYMIGIGDSGTMNEDGAIEELDKILSDIEYGAYVHVDPGGIWGSFGLWGFAQKAKDLLTEAKNGGYTQLTDEPTSPLRALLDLFGKDRVKK